MRPSSPNILVWTDALETKNLNDIKPASLTMIAHDGICHPLPSSCPDATLEPTDGSFYELAFYAEQEDNMMRVLDDNA